MTALRAADAEPTHARAHRMAQAYRASADTRPVYPTPEAIEALRAFDEPLGDAPTPADEVLEQLHRYGSPATVAQTGGRYFGFVCGGALPAALAARQLADTWDQNPAMYVQSPTVSTIEDVTERWLVDVLGLPTGSVAGFVGGSSTATLMGLVVGRNKLLLDAGHDVFGLGVFDAPRVRVVLSEAAHATVFKALSILGVGHRTVERVPADAMGRMRPEALPSLDDRTLLVLQAGHVNTGTFDDFVTLCGRAREAGAYVHVDGAFGLWTAASPRLRALTEGVALADSWSVDGHKTLNTPYDNGLFLCRHRELTARSMHMSGSYIVVSEARDGMRFSPEMSRRARAVDTWAALKSLGRTGLAEMVEELHDKARLFAHRLVEGGLEVVHDVVFNQVLARLPSDEATRALIQRVQDARVCWLGGATHQGQAVLRVSVSSYRTSFEDVERSAADIVRLAAELEAAGG